MLSRASYSGATTPIKGDAICVDGQRITTKSNDKSARNALTRKS
jgi:hypothetical protein